MVIEAPTPEEIRLRLQAARNQVLEGLKTLEAAEQALHQMERKQA